MSLHRLILTLILPLAATASCGGTGAGVSDTSPTEPAADLSGQWAGTWLSSTGVGGRIQLTMRQEANALDGDVRFTGSPCFSGGRFGGTVRGREFSGTLTAGSIRADMTATVTGSSYDGTYTTIEAGACTGDTGTFTASR